MNLAYREVPNEIQLLRAVSVFFSFLGVKMHIFKSTCLRAQLICRKTSFNKRIISACSNIPVELPMQLSTWYASSVYDIIRELRTFTVWVNCGLLQDFDCQFTAKSAVYPVRVRILLWPVSGPESRVKLLVKSVAYCYTVDLDQMLSACLSNLSFPIGVCFPLSGSFPAFSTTSYSSFIC